MGVKLKLALTLASATGRVEAGTTPGPPPLVATGLLRDWRFDEGSGDPIDRITGEVITLTGATWTPYGVVFDGVNDFGSFPTSLPMVTLAGLPASGIGVLFRIPSENAAVATNCIVSIAQALKFDWLTANDRPRFQIRTSDGSGALTLVDVADGAPIGGGWVYYYGDYDGAQQTFYVDGVSQGARADTGTMAFSGVGPRLGCDEGNNNFANIEVAALHIYGASVSAQTVADNHATLQAVLATRGP